MQKTLKYILYAVSAFVVFLLVKKYMGKKKNDEKREDNSGGGGGGGAPSIFNVPSASADNRKSNKKSIPTIVSSKGTKYVSPRFRT